MVLDEMRELLGERAPLRLVQQRMPRLHTNAALQKAYVLAGTAACKEQDLSNAAMFKSKLDAAADRKKLIAECKKLGMELIE